MEHSVTWIKNLKVLRIGLYGYKKTGWYWDMEIWLRILPKYFQFGIDKKEDYGTLDIIFYLFGITYWLYRAT